MYNIIIFLKKAKSYYALMMGIGFKTRKIYS